MGIKLTKEEYNNQLKELKLNTILVGEYNGTNSKSLHRCLIHDYEFYAQPSNVKNGYPCPLCNREKLRMKHESAYKSKLKTSMLVDNYIDNKTSVKHICLICNNTFFRTPHKLTYDKIECPICAMNSSRMNRRYTQDEFEDIVKTLNPHNLKICGVYDGIRSNIDVECLDCGNIWSANASNLVQGHGCPQCDDIKKGFERRKSNEDFINEIKIKRPSLIPIDEYITSYTHINFRCVDCGFVFNSTPSTILSGFNKCPKCHPLSSGEECISNYLIERNIDFEIHYRFDDLKGVGGKPLSYDFYIKTYNLLIEYQGEQHKNPVGYYGGDEKFEKQQEHDKRKREYAFNHNIELLEIWYYDFDNIETILNKKIKTLVSVETAGCV